MDRRGWGIHHMCGPAEQLVMTIHTIYEYPRDFPDHYVMRSCKVFESGAVMCPVACLYASLDEARNDLPRVLHRIPRQEYDEAQVVETWL